jgi:hypothetical protein
MREFANLDRCAAYVTARAALTAVQRVADSWPSVLAERARRSALATVETTAEATAHGHGSTDRRRCLRDAITSAVGVTASVDAAQAMGFGGSDLLAVQRDAGRAVALLAMFLHANSSPFPEDG